MTTAIEKNIIESVTGCENRNRRDRYEILSENVKAKGDLLFPLHGAKGAKVRDSNSQISAN